MTRFEVDSAAVAHTTAHVRSAISRIQSDVTGLHHQLVALQGSWSGSAALAFQSVVNDWAATQRRVEDSLAAIAQALDAAGRAYADVESANARLFAR